MTYKRIYKLWSRNLETINQDKERILTELSNRYVGSDITILECNIKQNLNINNQTRDDYECELTVEIESEDNIVHLTSPMESVIEQ